MIVNGEYVIFNLRWCREVVHFNLFPRVGVDFEEQIAQY